MLDDPRAQELSGHHRRGVVLVLQMDNDRAQTGRIAVPDLVHLLVEARESMIPRLRVTSPTRARPVSVRGEFSLSLPFRYSMTSDVTCSANSRRIQQRAAFRSSWSLARTSAL
jgi:hypothetical protein